MRRATTGDAEAVVRLATHFIAASPTYSRLITLNLAAIHRVIARVLESGVLLVAEDGGTAVGFIMGNVVVDELWQDQLLDELAWWVEPAYRRGALVGPRLLRTFEQWARDTGLGAVKMSAPVDAPEVGAFYLTQGYRVVETIFVKDLQHGVDRDQAAVRPA